MPKHRSKQRSDSRRGGKDRRWRAAIRRCQALVRRFIPGDNVDLTDELLEDRKRDAALSGLAPLADFRAELGSKVPPGVSLVDELLAERREEAKRG